MLCWIPLLFLSIPPAIEEEEVVGEMTRCDGGNTYATMRKGMQQRTKHKIAGRANRPADILLSMTGIISLIAGSAKIQLAGMTRIRHRMDGF